METKSTSLDEDNIIAQRCMNMGRYKQNIRKHLNHIQRIMHTGVALPILCIPIWARNDQSWPYTSGLLHCHKVDCMIDTRGGGY